MLTLDTIHHIDAIKLLNTLPDGCVDLLLTDPPYNTTACKWESDIATSTAFWEAVWRVTDTVVMTCTEPFTSFITYYNRAHFRHAWVWYKNAATNFLNAKKAPLRNHEDIRVFCSTGQPTYNPQMEAGAFYRSTQSAVYGHGPGGRIMSDASLSRSFIENDRRYPKTVKYWKIHKPNDGTGHPTQKPLDLITYFVKTYSNPGDLVVDPFAGSGTTAVACRNTDRRFLAGDTDAAWVSAARERLKQGEAYPVNTPDNLMQLSFLE